MIDSFSEDYAFLSNFYDSPLTVEDITYPTVEHYFQAQKTLNISERKRIAALSTPGEAKRAGRRVTLRHDWEAIKDEVMLKGVRMKFSNPKLRFLLLGTGNEYLVEGNWWNDHYWGVCRGIGENRLGKILMKVREEIQ